ncbi:MAG: hypothetical protein ACI87A_002820, partial [Planctomycetota bacterium]
LAHEDIHLRRINIDNWGSEVAEQHDITGIPHLLLYDDTEFITAGTGQVFHELAVRKQGHSRNFLRSAMQSQNTSP